MQCVLVPFMFVLENLKALKSFRPLNFEMEEHNDFKPGDLVWFEPGVGFPLPGEILEVHTAAQIIIVAASIDGKVMG